MGKSLENKLTGLRRLTTLPNKHVSGFFYIEPDWVINLLKDGLKWHQICKLFNCSSTALRRRVEIAYPDFRISKHGAYGTIIEEVLRLYKRFGSVEKVAENTGLTYLTARRRLKKAGINLGSGKRTDLTPDMVASLYSVIRNVSEVAKKLGTCIPTIERRLMEAGVSERYNPNLESRRTDISDIELIKMYQETKSLAPIAKKYNTSPQVIKLRLEKNGVEVIANYDKRWDIPTKDVLRMRREGYSMREIADHYHSTRKTIRRILNTR